MFVKTGKGFYHSQRENVNRVQEDGARERRQTDRKGRLDLGHAGQAGGRHVKSGIWFQSPSVFLCSTYTVTAEEIRAVVCLSPAERRRHVDAAAPAEATPQRR